MVCTQTTDTVALFGLPITNVTLDQAMARVEDQILSGRTHQIALATLHFARKSLVDSYLHRLLCECSMVLADGAPMLWASSLFGSRLKQRITAESLIFELAKLSARRGHGIFLLGSNEATCAAAIEVLETRYPGVRIVGRACPEVQPLHEMENEELLDMIEAANPAILLVALGTPKQEIWIHRHRDRLKVPVAIGVGGALEVIAGSSQRAPQWVRRARLGWLYRLVQEPFRVVPRYEGDIIALLRHLPPAIVATRLQPGKCGEQQRNVQVRGDVRIVATPGALTGAVCPWLIREAKAATLAGQTMVVDMSATCRVEADGLGGLLEARRILLAENLWIWLAGMSNPVRRVLQFSALSHLFRLAASPDEAVYFTSASAISRNSGTAVVAGSRTAAAAKPSVAKAS